LEASCKVLIQNNLTEVARVARFWGVSGELGPEEGNRTS
jgi:hypothetical protein